MKKVISETDSKTTLIIIGLDTEIILCSILWNNNHKKNIKKKPTTTKKSQCQDIYVSIFEWGSGERERVRKNTIIVIISPSRSVSDLKWKRENENKRKPNKCDEVYKGGKKMWSPLHIHKKLKE